MNMNAVLIVSSSVWVSLYASTNTRHLTVRELGDLVRKAVWEEGMIGWQYGTIGVSDGITMGSEGKFYPDHEGTY
jgi:dihydroxyacid dehydratase/phosphogluconate dehydratase